MDARDEIDKSKVFRGWRSLSMGSGGRLFAKLISVAENETHLRAFKRPNSRTRGRQESRDDL